MLFLESDFTEDILDTFTLVPLPKVRPLNYFEIDGTQNKNFINNIKIVNGTKFMSSIDDKGETRTTPQVADIAIQNTPKGNYDMMTAFDSLENGSTVLTSQLAGDLSGGSIDVNTDIDYISILRLGPEDNYRNYKEIAIVDWKDGTTKYAARDYLIDSHAVYFYSIRSVTINGTYGRIFNTKEALNTYEYDWIISDPKTHIAILNSKISSVSYNSKDGTIEPIGATYATVNRFSNLSYRSFTLTGTIASQTDLDGSLGVATRKNQDIPARLADRIKNIYQSKLGYEPTAVNNSLLVDTNQERLVKEQAMKILNDGKPKLFKSPTEGLMYVKLSKIQLNPKDNLSRYVADFSAQVTEIGEVTEDVLDYFKIVDTNYYQDI